MNETRRPQKKSAMKQESPAPILIRRGSATVKIYEQVNREHPLYSVVYYIGKRRIHLNRANFAEAKRIAEEAAVKLANGQVDLLTLSTANAQNYVLAQRELRSLGLPLHAAIRGLCASDQNARERSAH